MICQLNCFILQKGIEEIMGNTCGQASSPSPEKQHQIIEDLSYHSDTSDVSTEQRKQVRPFLMEGASKDILSDFFPMQQTQKSIKIHETLKTLKKLKSVPKIEEKDGGLGIHSPFILEILGQFSVKRPSLQNYNWMRIEVKDFVGEKKGSPESDFLLMDKVGKGGYGQVFRAKDKKNGELRAIKRMNKKEMKKADRMALLNEVELLKKLDHPNVLKIYDTYEDEEHYFIVMEFCQGGTLRGLLNDCQLGENSLRTIMRQLLRAVNYLHTQSIVHRDIKLENVMISSSIQGGSNLEDISIRLIDFGVAVDTSQGPFPRGVFGTLMYMPPEFQASRLGSQWDMWSCGIMLYIMSTLKLPYMYSSNEQLQSRIKHVQVIKRHLSSLSKDLRMFINALLEPKIGKRLNAQRALKNRWISANTQTTIRTSVKSALARNLLQYNPANNLISLIESYLIFSKLGKCERNRLGQLFNQIDTDHSGQIETRQLQKFLTESKVDYMGIEDIRIVASRLDKDKSGTIDFNEFLNAMFQKKELFKEEALSEAFRYLDRNGSGFLEKGQLMTMLEGADAKQVQELFKLLDMNKDDQISIEEFMEYLLSTQQGQQ